MYFSRYLACPIFHGCRRRISDSLRSCLWSFTLGDCHSRERVPICLQCRAFVGDLSKPVCEWKIGLKSCSVNLALDTETQKNVGWCISAVTLWLCCSFFGIAVFQRNFKLNCRLLKIKCVGYFERTSTVLDIKENSSKVSVRILCNCRRGSLSLYKGE